jgi:RNA polymerase sigma-70 factor, ECF subfamily
MNGMEPSDQAMVEAIRSGDETAAARLIHLYYQRVYAFLRRLSGNEEDAADLTQRTFSRVWQALESFAGRSSLSSWIHGIAYHIYVDWRRRYNPGEPRSDEWWATRPAPEDSPDEIAGRNDLASRLYQLVEHLSADLRETIHLHYYQGLSLQETADAMEVATSTVKYRQRLAISELQQKVAADGATVRSATLTKP